MYTTSWLSFGDNRPRFEDSVPTTTIRKGNGFGHKLTFYIKTMALFQIISAILWVATEITIRSKKIRDTLLACTNHQSDPKSKSDGGRGILDIEIQSQSS